MITSKRTPKELSQMTFKLAVALIFLSVVGSGCTLDFEEFNAGKTPVSGSDTGVTNNTDKDGDQSDIDPGQADAIGDTDLPSNLALGEFCKENKQCGDDGLCMGGYCTQACDPSADSCESGSSCHKVGDLQVCVLDCDVYESCTDVSARDDLGCVDLIDFHPGGATLKAARACLPDADKDRVFDLHDNCPEVANASQIDSDGDGIGDACDTEIYCHKDATEGYLEYPLIDFAPTGFSIPETIDGTWLPIIGGRQNIQMSPEFLILDRANASWSKHAMPYRAAEYGIASTRDGNFLLTPGETPSGQQQNGSTLILQKDGQTRPSFSFLNSLLKPSMGTSLLGVPVIHGYLESPPTSWTIRAYDSDSGQYRLLRSWADSTRRAWHTVTDLQGSVWVYTNDSFNQIAPLGAALVATKPVFPAISETRAIDPFVLPMPGGHLYAWDRQNGEAVRFSPTEFMITEPEDEQAAKSFELVLAMPALNIDLSGLLDVRFVAMPKARGLMVIARPAATPGKLVVREYNFSCMSSTDWPDVDDDGIPDILDNCPFLANPDQLDTDGDSIGDACDADRDGDGIPNDEDAIVGKDENNDDILVLTDLDSDNDGVPNATDDDIDGDGIPNAQDRFPLDSNNDGIPNWLTNDADGDGFTDVVERINGTNAYNPMNFPNSGAVVYIDKSAGKRVLKVSTLTNFKDGFLPFEIPEDANPHFPQLTSDKQQMIYLVGAPGKTSKFGLYNAPTVDGDDVVIPATASVFETSHTLRSISIQMPADGDRKISILATHENPQAAGQWRISTITVNNNDTLTSGVPVVAAMPEIKQSIIVGSHAYFLGGPGTCDTCLNLYRTPLSPGVGPTLVPTPVLTPTNLQQDMNRAQLIGHTASEPDQAIYTILGDNNAQKQPLPSGVVSINSFRQVSNTAHRVLSGAGKDGIYGLWFYNGVSKQWHRISNPENDIIEISWVP